MYCESCKELTLLNPSILTYIQYCKKYNKELKSERLTDSWTMRDELCVYKCNECKELSKEEHNYEM